MLNHNSACRFDVQLRGYGAYANGNRRRNRHAALRRLIVLIGGYIITESKQLQVIKVTMAVSYHRS